MDVKEKRKWAILIILLIISTAMVYRNQIASFFSKNNPPTQTVIYDGSSEEDVDSTLNSESQTEVSEEVVESPNSPLNTRNTQFSSMIDAAYANEENILKGREFVLAFYNVNGKQPEPDTFKKYAIDPIADALFIQYKELVDRNVKRQESITTYTLISESPLTITYTIIGIKNDEKEQVTYEIIFDDKQDKIISFVQVTR